MKLKYIPCDTAVHTPTEAEAKELLAILHENGYKWCGGSSLIEDSEWEDYQEWTCYWISSYVEIDNIHECNGGKINPITLAEFKSKYCEEEKPQPKFREGDIMRVTDAEHPLYNKQVKLDTWIDGGNYWLTINMSCGLNEFRESDLEPYTEPETKPTEDVETNEFDLYELLKDYKGTIYSVVHDTDVEFKLANRYIELMGIEYYSNGSMYDVAGRCLLYPSRALYEQYPLNPYTAWMKWQEEQKKHELWVTMRPSGEDPDIIQRHQLRFYSAADRDKCIEEIIAIINKYSK